MLLLGIELYIDVGANSIDEVKELGVDILNPVTFYKNFIIMNRGKVISCKAIDNRVGCFILLQLAKMLSKEIKNAEVCFA